MGKVFAPIVEDARSARAYGSAALEIISGLKVNSLRTLHQDYNHGFCWRLNDIE